jgi:cytochrome c oxidase subunit 3
VLKHHFDNLEQQHSAERLGMWMFLATEVLFFSGLFVAYTVYRYWFPHEFQFASSHLILWVAAINTALLITSSLTMTFAIRAAQLGDQKGLILNLWISALLGTGFMAFKAYEYSTDYHERLVPGAIFDAEYAGPVAELRAENERRAREGRSPMTSEEVAKFEFKGHHQHWSEDLARHNAGKSVGDEGYLSPGRIQLFLCFYYIMTGIHGIHIIVGIGCILWLVQQAYAGLIPRENYSTVEVVSLYWHLVDMIWLFLMPLLYLTGAGLGKH